MLSLSLSKNALLSTNEKTLTLTHLPTRNANSTLLPFKILKAQIWNDVILACGQREVYINKVFKAPGQFMGAGKYAAFMKRGMLTFLNEHGVWVGEAEGPTAQSVSFWGDKCYVIASDGLYVWDLIKFKCVSKMPLPYGAKVVAVHGDIMAMGTSSGLVTLYTLEMKEIKSYGCLVSSIESMAWHPSGKLLAFASKVVKDAMRLVTVDETGEGSVCSWPTSSTPLGYVNDVVFGESVVCVGNKKGRVLVYKIGAK